MPTGYTAGVQDGTIADFQSFLFRCARAFGALVEMRDDSMDAPIPEAFKPSSYHSEALAKAQRELADVRAMTPDDAEAAAEAAYVAAQDYHAEREARRRLEEKRYRAMLTQVRSWVPPSEEHEELKRFMAEQLSKSIEFDCSETTMAAPSRLSGEMWLSKAISEAEDSVSYHQKHLAEDTKRAEERTRWVQQLRESVATVTASE